MSDLSRDPSLTPAQRAYLAGIDREETAGGAISAIVGAGMAIFAALAAVLHAAVPGLLPPWAFALARFWACLGVTLAPVLVVIGVVLVLAVSFVKAPVGDGDRTNVASAVRYLGRVSPVRTMVCRVAFAVQVAGFAMGDYLVLPLLMVAAWVSVFAVRLVIRSQVVEAVRVIVPEPATE